MLKKDGILIERIERIEIYIGKDFVFPLQGSWFDMSREAKYRYFVDWLIRKYDMKGFEVDYEVNRSGDYIVSYWHSDIGERLYYDDVFTEAEIVGLTTVLSLLGFMLN